jgi:hypothetical protein
MSQRIEQIGCSSLIRVVSYRGQEPPYLLSPIIASLHCAMPMTHTTSFQFDRHEYDSRAASVRTAYMHSLLSPCELAIHICP